MSCLSREWIFKLLKEKNIPPPSEIWRAVNWEMLRRIAFGWNTNITFEVANSSIKEITLHIISKCYCIRFCIKIPINRAVFLLVQNFRFHVQHLFELRVESIKKLLGSSSIGIIGIGILDSSACEVSLSFNVKCIRKTLRKTFGIKLR